jgi:glycosyltransferase involved in cell wall biosynthesis
VGGVETHVSELAKRSSGRFSKVSVVTTDPSGRLPKRERALDGSTVYRVRSFAPNENFYFPTLPGLVRNLREARSQILHLHSIHDIPGPLAALFESQSSLVLTPHFHGKVNSMLGRLAFGMYRALLARLIERVALVICVSRFEAGLMRDFFPASSNKIRIIPNGLDMDLLSQYSWSEPDDPMILYVGRLERYKNVDKILRAVALLRQRQTDASLTIVGSGPARSELVRLAQRLHVERWIRWTKGLNRSELYQLYSTSSLVILPSDLEAYGIVAAEAIASGTPTIVENSSALSEFVEAGLAVPVDPPVDPSNLSNIISEVLSNPEGFSFRARAKGFIRSWDEVAEMTFAAYESIRPLGDN